jgi:hypothetical protein
MELRYLFSRNTSIGSYLIRLGSLWIDPCDFQFNDIPSHAAVLIDDTYVIESVMLGGVRIIPYNKWLEHNTEVMSIPAPSFSEHPRDLMFEMWGKKYDKLGIMYFAVSILKNKLFGIPMPKQNKCEQEDCYFCTEFASRIYDGNTGSMRTPVQLMRLIKGQQLPNLNQYS